jgi:predicted trehalose synthase
MALTRQIAMGRLAADERHAFAPWTERWRLWVSVAFLKGYFDTLGHSPLLPAADAELQALLDIYLLQRMVAELGNHLVMEQALVKPACEGILQLLQHDTAP